MVKLLLLGAWVHNGGNIRVEDRVKGDPAQGSVFMVELPQA